MGNEIERAAFNQVEAAQYLGVSDKTIRKLLKEGTIRCAHVGSRVLIAKAELDRFLVGDIGDEWACASLDGKRIYNTSKTADMAIAKSSVLEAEGIKSIIIRV
jgi:excisionase family DNA binding protein